MMTNSDLHTLTFVDGPDSERTIAVRPGDRLILGRNSELEQGLNSQDVAWEHVAISESSGHLFIENLAARGTYVNDLKIANKTRLNTGDRVRLSPNCLFSVELAGQGAEVGSSGLLLAIVVAIVLTIGVLWFARPGPKDDASADQDWPATFYCLEEWQQQKVADGTLQVVVLDLYREGWRLSQAQRNAKASRIYADLDLLISSLDVDDGGKQMSFAMATHRYPKSLLKLLETGCSKMDELTEAEKAAVDELTEAEKAAVDELTEAEKAAALTQFVRSMLKWTSQKANEE